MTDDQPLKEHANDPLLDLMIETNIPLTRENYLTLMFMGDPPEWSAEYEAEIPEFLQDWEYKSFEPRNMAASEPSKLGQKHFNSLTAEELDELGKET